MTLCVLDSSVALAWILPGEGGATVEPWRVPAATQGVVVPSLWLWEMGNVLLMAERRGRITLADRNDALGVLADMPIRIDEVTPARAWGDVLHLAAAHRLTSYDASYLELALRTGLPLASLDRQLRGASQTCGVALLPDS